MPSTRGTGGQSSGGGASGRSVSSQVGSPSRQALNAPSASTSGRPSWSSRPLSVVVERPARSTVAHTSASPAPGASA